MKQFDYDIKFEEYFLTDKFKTSTGEFRKRYEVCMADIDFWINSLGLPQTILITKYDLHKFKVNLFRRLKNKGWQNSQIRGRYIKNIYL